MRTLLSGHPLAAARLLLPGLALALALAATGLNAVPPTAAQTTEQGGTVTFNYTGKPQTWTVPPDVTQALFSVAGAQGGATTNFYGTAKGGLGGSAEATLAVTPGAVYQINVGGHGGDSGEGTIVGAGGLNGGAAGGGLFQGLGQGGGGGGGGASDVRSGSYSLAERLLVAGGGGGAGFCQLHAGDSDGGGGGLTGSDGHGGNGDARPGGHGGEQSAGGAGGTPVGALHMGDTGVLGDGGTGAGGNGGGGGGAGGYYGGGGGADGNCANGNPGQGPAGGGGGGSGYGPSRTTFGTGVRSGDGLVTITYPPPPPTPTPTATATPTPWRTETFNYTGGPQTWTVPPGVSAGVFLGRRRPGGQRGRSAGLSARAGCPRRVGGGHAGRHPRNGLPDQRRRPWG